MMDEPKPNRRIVSRNEYLWTQSGRLFGVIIALCIGLLSLGLFGACVNSIYDILLIDKNDDKFSPVFLIAVDILGACVSVFFGCLALWTTRYMLFKVRTIDPGIPLTRANTADLPAEESFVRPSSEPIEQQQAVLLRAASQTDTTPAEQLVRPSEGQN